MIYKAIVNGKEIEYGALVERSRFTDEEFDALADVMVKSNYDNNIYKKYKSDPLVMNNFAHLIDIQERYEALLELLPQSSFSKAGSHPRWVAESVEDNVYHKILTKSDVKDMIESAKSKKELVAELTRYFDL